MSLTEDLASGGGESPNPLFRKRIYPSTNHSEKETGEAGSNHMGPAVEDPEGRVDK